MPRIALGLIVAGLLSVLMTVVMVMGELTVPGRLPAMTAAWLAAGGGVLLVLGLCFLESRHREGETPALALDHSGR